MKIELPGLVNCHRTNWKDPPCYLWVNQLFRLGHFQVRKLYVYPRVMVTEMDVIGMSWTIHMNICRDLLGFIRCNGNMGIKPMFIQGCNFRIS